MSITTVAINKEPDNTIENNFQKIQKRTKIILQTLLLMMMLNYLKHQDKIITASIQQVPNNLQEQHQHRNHLGETCIFQFKKPSTRKIIIVSLY